jgi:LmbE family N-acetylglucosaminyl deacetylase
MSTELALAIVIGLAGLGCAVLFARFLFEEPKARRVRSLIPDAACTTLLGVFAHPDDEILVAASLAQVARSGCRVYTVTATHGLRGAPVGFAGDEASLARLRETELRQFGRELGVTEQEIWNFPDGGLSSESTEELVDSVLSAIRRYRPDLIVTFDATAGFTGHADHRRIGEIAFLAWERSCDSAESNPGVHSGPRWIAQVLFPRRAARFVWKGDLRRRLLRQPSASVAVSADGRWKLIGMRIHQSQQRFFPPSWVRPLLTRLYDREHFVVTECDRRKPAIATEFSTE